MFSDLKYRHPPINVLARIIHSPELATLILYTYTYILQLAVLLIIGQFSTFYLVGCSPTFAEGRATPNYIYPLIVYIFNLTVPKCTILYSCACAYFQSADSTTRHQQLLRLCYNSCTKGNPGPLTCFAQCHSLHTTVADPGIGRGGGTGEGVARGGAK